MTPHFQRQLVVCPHPGCGCKVRADRLEKHRRKAHGWQSEAEKEAAVKLAQKEKAATQALVQKVTEEICEADRKGRLAATLYRMSHPKKRRHLGRSAKKTKKRPWPGPEGMKSGFPIYTGAFEMNRRKH
jgi:hypothetical protein